MMCNIDRKLSQAATVWNACIALNRIGVTLASASITWFTEVSVIFNTSLILRQYNPNFSRVLPVCSEHHINGVSGSWVVLFSQWRYHTACRHQPLVSAMVRCTYVSSFSRVCVTCFFAVCVFIRTTWLFPCTLALYIVIVIWKMRNKMLIKVTITFFIFISYFR